jgi:hypothetical protein
MSGIEQSANDLFFKLRNRFPRINMGDEDGTTTSNPTDARFFNFDYEQDDVKFGNITASLIDGQNLKLYFSQDVTKYMDREEKLQWYRFLQEIRKFAKAHMLGLDIRDIAKDVLNDKDLKFVSNQNKEKSQIGESRVLWARRGTVSEGNVGNVKVHVVHSERMDENPHNRLLRVDRIFLVNESGERFLLPFKSVIGAKAMANHVGRGGNPYDNTGKLISTAVTEMTNLRRFAAATRRKTFESEDAGQVITAAQTIKESIKRSLFRLANNSRFDENIEDLGKLLAEQDTVEDIKPMFKQNTYNENLDNWIGSAAKAFKMYKENIMENLRESAASVTQKLSDPNWLMVLKDDPSEDRLITTSKYSDGRSLLRRILGTIADRASLEDSDIANWASQMGQDIEEGKASQQDMQLALQLAKRYQNDLAQIAKSPEYAKQVRVSAFGLRKHLNRKAKDESMEFEDYVNDIGEKAEEYTDAEDDLDPGFIIEPDQEYPGPKTTPSDGPSDEDWQNMVHNKVDEYEDDGFTDEKGHKAVVPGSTMPPEEPSVPLPPRRPPNLGSNTPVPTGPSDDEIINTMKNSPGNKVGNESAEGHETPMDRVSARVAARTTTNESLDTMLWLSGIKKKSEISEADPRADVLNFLNQRDAADPAPSEITSAEPAAKPRINIGRAATGVAPDVQSPELSFSTSDTPLGLDFNKGTIGSTAAPEITPPTTAEPTTYFAPEITPPTKAEPVGDLPFKISTFGQKPPTPGTTSGLSGLPDELKSLGKALPGLAGQAALKVLPKVAGGAVANIMTPTPAGQGDVGPHDKDADIAFSTTPISKQNVMMPGKSPDAMAPGTLTDPDLLRMKQLAGTGK